MLTEKAVSELLLGIVRRQDTARRCFFRSAGLGMAWLTHLTRILHTFYRGCLSVFSGLSYNKRSMATCIRGQLS